MSERQECKLGQLVERGVAFLQTGPFGTMLNSSEYTVSGVPVIAVQDIGENRLRHNKFVYVNEGTVSRLSRYKVKEGDIIFGRKGAVDRRARIRNFEEGWLQGSDCIRLRFDSSIDPTFISYQFGSNFYKEWMLQNSTGATMPSLNQEVLKLLPIMLPPLPEQKAIAAVLSSLDDKIDLLHRQNKTLEAMAETLFRQWFVEEAQEDWKPVKVNDFVDVLSGFAFKSGTFTEPGTYRLITIKAVQDGYLELAGADRINEVPSKVPDYCYLKHGDILLSLTGNVGRCCLVDDEGLLLNQRVAKLRARNKRDWAFVYVMFRQSSMRQYLEEMAKGTAQANLSPIETANMEVSLPPIKTLERFSEIATPLLEKVLFNKSQIRTLEKLRDTLLPKLMSGEVRVALDA